MAKKDDSEISIADKRVKTPKFRVSFPALDKPKAFGEGAPKYGVTMLFDKSTVNLSKPILNKKGEKVCNSMEAALMYAATEQWGAKAEAVVAKLKKSAKGWPIRDGDSDKPDMESHQGMLFVAASAKEDKKPGIVNYNKEPLEPKDLYAGCYARASLVAYAYDNEFGKGLGFSLQNLQKIGDGPKFGGKRAAEDDFDEIEEESDGPSNYEESDDNADEDDDGGF